MAIIQTGPPEWIFERPADPLKWEIVERQATNGSEQLYEIRLACGLQILRMYVFNQQELWALADAIGATLPKPTA